MLYLFRITNTKTKGNMKTNDTSKPQKMRITIEDGIDPVVALERVKAVVSKGRISKYGTLYCYVTEFADGITVAVSDYRKSDCFLVYKKKKN